MLVGRADVVDGDTIAIGGADIDLSGIDAPELRQTCLRDGAAWTCGDDARQQLRSFIADRTVRCDPQDHPADAAPVAICTAGTLDLAGAMVEAGLAVALGPAATGYGADADRARRDRIGLWSSEFQPPADWRAANPAPPLAAAADTARRAAPRSIAGRAPPPAPAAVVSSGACTIKGNRNYRGEWIYHLPDMPYYDRTRAEEWFCTEAQAQAAGYRRSRARR